VLVDHPPGSRWTGLYPPLLPGPRHWLVTEGVLHKHIHTYINRVLYKHIHTYINSDILCNHIHTYINRDIGAYINIDKGGAIQQHTYIHTLIMYCSITFTLTDYAAYNSRTAAKI